MCGDSRARQARRRARPRYWFDAYPAVREPRAAPQGIRAPSLIRVARLDSLLGASGARPLVRAHQDLQPRRVLPDCARVRAELPLLYAPPSL